MTPPTRIVHVVDDDDSIRTAVMRLLRVAGYEVRGYPSGWRVSACPAGRHSGLRSAGRAAMPGTSGLNLQVAPGEEQYDALPVIFLTGHGDIPMKCAAHESRAVDFLTKPVKQEALLSAVQNALVRDESNRKARASRAALHARYQSLTPCERDVFSLVVAGKLNKQIASELGTSDRTVKAHRAKVMEKMHVASLAELVHVAEQLQTDTPSRSNPGTTSVDTRTYHQREGSASPKYNTAPLALLDNTHHLMKRVGDLREERIEWPHMSGARPRIVVVKDDASMSQAIERILRAGGIRVVVFASAEAALRRRCGDNDRLPGSRPSMPGISGFELYRRLALAARLRPSSS